MKPDLFATALCAHGRRALTSIPFSFLPHAIAVAATVALPLLAANRLPEPKPGRSPQAERSTPASAPAQVFAPTPVSAPAPSLISEPRDQGDGDKTLAPYFVVKDGDPDRDQFPLKATSVAVRISGVIARVRVSQTYENHGRRPLECVYVFPGSTRAAVHALRMTIGERVIVASIREREQAREEYENARRQGRSAALLEQERPNVFQMNVANILPGDVVKVEMTYAELLVPIERVYEFVFPTVVGPRYSNREPSSVPEARRFVAKPYLHQGEEAPHTLDLAVDLTTGMPVTDLVCVSHQTHIRFRDPTRASVRLAQSETHGANRDFRLQYRLAGGEVQSGMLLHRGRNEDFFRLVSRECD